MRERRYGRRAVFAKVDILPGSRPTPCESPVSVEALEQVRRTNCARYANCLDHACGELDPTDPIGRRRGWRGWDCLACPVYEPMTRNEHADQLEGLAALLREVAGPNAVRLRNGCFGDVPVRRK